MNWLAVTLLVVPLVADGELVWLPESEAQSVFASASQPIKAMIRNTGGEHVEKAVFARLYQTGSETMAPVGKPWLWKRLAVLPGQTVLEEIKVAFPKVDAAASFRLFWLDEAGSTLATTDVRAYPDHLLRSLAGMAGERPLGVFDPGNRLKPLLNAEEIEFEELTADGHPEAFKGRMAIIAPLESSTQMPDHFAQELGRVARERGLALVWFQSLDKRRFDEPPVAYPVRDGRATTIMAPASLLARIDISPRSQLNLVWLAGVAVQRTQMALPATN